LAIAVFFLRALASSWFLTGRLPLAKKPCSTMGWRCLPTIWLPLLLAGGVSRAELNEEGIRFFESKIRPLLIEHCYACHSLQLGESQGDLRLDSRASMLRGGSRGSVIQLDKPEASLLLKAIDYGDPELQMPPKGKLAEEQIAAVRHWLSLGAPDPRVPLEKEAGEPASRLAALTSQASRHWAYQPLELQQPIPLAPPSSRSVVSAPASPLDAILAAERQAVGLSGSPPADPRTLIRRLYYDLVGLPPTWNDLEGWRQRGEAFDYEGLVDKLLSSSHFGERMARRWMDVARYADNKGYVFQEDREYPQAFRYRDWLIRVFNEDLPFFDFVRYQLAADHWDPDNRNGHLDAMGFLTLGRRFLQNKHDIIDDRIDVVSRGLMGITASCARCHDHKFDPVSMRDYYSLYAVFDNSQEPGNDPSPLRLADKESMEAAYIFVRGNPGNRGASIERQFFGFLSPTAGRPLTTGSGRRELAEAIATPDNPLTARVYVNRVWGWLLGQPLVDTPSDFGLRCQPPPLQAALDELTRNFIRHDGSTKRLIKEIVMSASYRQSSQPYPAGRDQDPENRWLWRANRKRMDFESYRDAMLAVTGQLEASIGGSSQRIETPPFSRRRTLYAYIDRQNLPQLFRAFDFASPDSHVPQRSQTTVPQQGLMLLNSDWMLRIVADFSAAYTLAADDAGRGQQVTDLFRQVLARTPSAEELQRSLDFLSSTDDALVTSPINHWRYGFGTIERETGQVLEFSPFPYFDGERWRGRDGFPDPGLGWCMLHRDGGHPGDAASRVPIRRWTAMQPGILEIRGKLVHAAAEGDGIQAYVVHNTSQRLGSWQVKQGKVDTLQAKIEVEVGDTLDFIVDCITEESHDSFEWKVVLHDSERGLSFDSAAHFSGMQPVPASRFQQLAQALLLTNEFVFVD
jgi:hypothetical protein